MTNDNILINDIKQYVCVTGFLDIIAIVFFYLSSRDFGYGQVRKSKASRGCYDKM